ncbi:MAG: PAS domain-containing protein [Calditrichaeota bacterium]|nr:PAS domain-containing protein [Calditrichota bacterium]
MTIFRIIDQKWLLMISTPDKAVDRLLTHFSMNYSIASFIVLFFILCALLIVAYLIYRCNAKRIFVNEQLQQSEDKIRQQNEFLTKVLDSLTHPFYVIDAKDYTIKIMNLAAKKIGVTEDTKCHSFFHASDAPCGSTEHLCPLDEIMRTKQSVIVEHIHRDKAGSALNIEVHGFPLFDKAGNIVQMIAYSQDITERKKAEENIKLSLKEKEILLGEIHHRVKNNLQVIYSLLSIQSKYVKTRRYSDIFKDCQNQIMSMALVHENLYQAENLTNINLYDYMKNLTRVLLQSYGVNSSKIKIEIDVEHIPIKIDTLILCGLIINELVSNSIKHAFPNKQKGVIKISLHSIADNEFKLIVSDNGVGFPKDIDFKNPDSFGLQLINLLVEGRLEGQIILKYDNGTEFQIKFKEIQG